MAKTPPKFIGVINVETPILAKDETYSADDQERDFGEAVLRRWVKVARWNWSDREVADILEKSAATLREQA